MASLLLVFIYLAFISLGLPDSLLGSAWPIMHPVLSVPVSFQYMPEAERNSSFFVS